MNTSETVTLSWIPDPKATAAVVGGAAGGGGAGGPALVIPSRLGSVRLIRELGHGGMGVVWLGHHEFLDRQVAVKFLLATVTDRDDPKFQVFLDGARAAAQVRHLGLTSVLHADIVENVPYLVMEYISGPTLAELVERTGSLHLPATLAVLERIADALDELHEAGVIHRDIKPSNILVDVQGQAYLTDFGLACRIENRERMTTSGTPAYMAPECFDGEFTARTDIYALAATTYHLLAGRAPYAGSLGELRELHKAQTFPPDPLRSVSVPNDVIEVLHRAANGDPRFRTKSCRKMLEGFREAAGKAVTCAAGVDQLARMVTAIRERAAGGGASPTTPSGAQPGGGGSAALLTPGLAQQPEAHILTEPVPCVECGYELRGLPSTARCPECQHPIERSLSAERLIFADAAWLRRLHLGVWLLAAAMALLPISTLFITPLSRLLIADVPGLAWWIAVSSVAVLLDLAAAYRVAAAPERNNAVREPFQPRGFWVLVGATVVAIVCGVLLVRAARVDPGQTSRVWLWAGLLLGAFVVGAVVVTGDYAWRIWDLLRRGPRCRARWLDHAALAAMLIGAGVAVYLALGAVRVWARGGPFVEVIAAKPFAAVAWWSGVGGAAALAVMAWRIGCIRRVLVRIAPVEGRRGPAAPSGSGTYYQNLSTLADKRRGASVDATPPAPCAPATSPSPGTSATPGTPGDVLRAQVPCLKCGYSLAGLSVEARCPECAAPARDSLRPARLIFADPAALTRASRGLDKAALTLLIGLLVLLVTLPFQAAVSGATSVFPLIYAPVWIAVMLVAIDGCWRAAVRLGRPEADRAAAPWRWTMRLAALASVGAMVGYGLWLWRTGAFFSDTPRPTLALWPGLVLLVPTGVVPPLLAGFAAALSCGGDSRQARRLWIFAGSLAVGLVGLAIAYAMVVLSPDAATDVRLVMGLLILSAPAAFIALFLTSGALRRAAAAHVDYSAVRAALSPPAGGGPS